MADQIRIQDTKEKFETVYNHAVSSEKSAKAYFKQEQDAGLADGQNFNNWAAQNAPAYLQAHSQYRAARAAYEAALQNGDQEGYKAWQEKVKKAAFDNPGPNGPDFNFLVGPN
ncbi:uncharacterized protein BKA55DRAFT_537547 [Fusarium redolens]|uniref:Uncharacterized protein n=1 Tax=Fusarium redolens TaxID=48865 RepID=A0A9P9KFC0_FUSRE|nr:uncharacterized protein BKA55DRAFT_537547 [Fusarium redolens]KAH7255135.1 hypothetical protein BKA55DRAFT_537547 [Fusarium redolens]